MIELAHEVVDLVRRHGETTYPEECCGVLLGLLEGEMRSVTQALPIQNARDEKRERRFLITADDYRRADHEAQDRGLLLIGFYHSHPDHPARPSQYDLDHALPWHSYVVLAVEKGRAAACTSWILAADRTRFLPEDLTENRT